MTGDTIRADAYGPGLHADAVAALAGELEGDARRVAGQIQGDITGMVRPTRWSPRSRRGSTWKGFVARDGKGEVWQDPASVNPAKGMPENRNTFRIKFPDSRLASVDRRQLGDPPVQPIVLTTTDLEGTSEVTVEVDVEPQPLPPCAARHRGGKDHRAGDR